MQRVSIVIPCYSQAHLLPRAIESCLAQSYKNLEIIVIDDGSPDDVSTAVLPYTDKVKLISQTNRGLAGARNRGLEEAEGYFIKFLDADDWLFPECIELQVRSLHAIDGYFSVIGHRLDYIDNLQASDDIYPDFGKLSHQLCYINTGPPHTFLFTTESVRAINGFNHIEGGHEDYDLLCRLVLNSYDVVALHTIGCSYTQSSGSMSTNNTAMQQSRKEVWLMYVRQLLLQREMLPVEDLVHLFAGYVQRVDSEDILYEGGDILDTIVQQITTSNLPLNKRILWLLTENLIQLQKLIPRRDDTSEPTQLPKEQHIKLLNTLYTYILERYPNDLLKNVKRSNRLLELFLTHLWVKRSLRFQSFIRKILSIKFHRAFWILPLQLTDQLLDLVD